MLPIDLVFVRHGQSEANLAKRRSEAGDHSVYTEEFKNRHSSSFRLTNLGKTQALNIGNLIKKEFSFGFDRYITSEYLRAMETAALMDLPDAQWYRDVYLTERNWGDLDISSEEERQKKFDEVLKKRTIQPFFWKPPNGESFLELCLRVDRVLHTLHRECSDKRVIIVCHGEVMLAFRVRLERMSQERFRRVTFSEEFTDRILNCQAIHYTRRNPETKNLEKYANWFRLLRAEKLVTITGWQKIERRVYSNEYLLEIVSRESPMITE